MRGTSTPTQTGCSDVYAACYLQCCAGAFARWGACSAGKTIYRMYYMVAVTKCDARTVDLADKVKWTPYTVSMPMLMHCGSCDKNQRHKYNRIWLAANSCTY